MKDLKIYIKESSEWGNLSEKDEQEWNKLWDEYVPASGKAKTVGGEIMRAMNVLVYRFYNDGDTVQHYGGSSKNILWGANEYLCMRSVKGYDDSLNIISNDEKYEKVLCSNLKKTLDFLKNNPDLFKKENNKDYQDLAIDVKDSYDDYDDDEY